MLFNINPYKKLDFRKTFTGFSIIEYLHPGGNKTSLQTIIIVSP